MSFSSNLRAIREQRNMSQKQLANLLGVSRITVAEWEQGGGYPQTETVILIAKKLDVSLDCLLLDKKEIDEAIERTCKQRGITRVGHSGMIAILSLDGKEMGEFDTFEIVKARFWLEGRPRCTLAGEATAYFWFQSAFTHLPTTYNETLGWYATEEDAEQELSEISRAIQNGDKTYQLKYLADIECRGPFRGKRLK